MKHFYLFLLLITSCQLLAQNRVNFNQYMINPQTYNPGYIDVMNEYGASVMYRRQYLQKISGPQNIFANGFYNISRNHGVGLSVSNESANKFNQTEAGVNYVYHLWHNETLAIGLGVQANFYQQVYNQNNYFYFDPNEPTLEATRSIAGVNFGAGISLQTRDLVVNFGMPRFFANGMVDPDNRFRMRNTAMYLSGGYKIRPAEGFVFFPSAIIKSTLGAPISYGADLSFILLDKYFVGAGYKSSRTVNVNFGMIFNNRLRIVYNLESMPFSSFTGAGFSHELSVFFGQAFGPLDFGKRHHINKSGRVKGTKKYKLKETKY